MRFSRFLALPARRHRLRPSRGRGGRGGFTLVELLVAMTVLLVLVGILLGVFNATATSWQRGETRADGFREARAALALMARDLGGTVPPMRAASANNAGNPGSPLVPSLVLDRHPDDAADGGGDNPNEQAHCLTLTPNRPARSGAVTTALCAVSYFCRWDAKRTTWSLARRLVDSDATFQRLRGASGGPSPLPFAAVFKREPATLTDHDDIAAYVWDLQFRVPGNLQLPAPAPAGAYAVDPPYSDRLPPYVEIRFKALSAAAGARLRGEATPGTWTDPESALYRTVIRPGAQQFVQRVPLHTAVP